jgi:hypothetical protein
VGRQSASKQLQSHLATLETNAAWTLFQRTGIYPPHTLCRQLRCLRAWVALAQSDWRTGPERVFSFVVAQQLGALAYHNNRQHNGCAAAVNVSDLPMAAGMWLTAATQLRTNGAHSS